MPTNKKNNAERVNVFFSREVLSSLKKAAKAKGMSVSGLIRMIVMGWLQEDA